MCYILIRMVVAWMCAIVKPHQIVHFILCSINPDIREGGEERRGELEDRNLRKLPTRCNV